MAPVKREVWVCDNFRPSSDPKKTGHCVACGKRKDLHDKKKEGQRFYTTTTVPGPDGEM